MSFIINPYIFSESDPKTLDDFDYLGRWEGENARRHYVSGSGDVQTTGKNEAFFDGQSPDDRFDVYGNESDWNFAANDFTIEFYAKWNSIDDSGLVGRWDDSGTNRPWLVRYDGDVNLMKFEWENTSSVYNAEDFSWTPTVGVWYHISFVNNGGTLTFRVDGTTVGSAATITEIVSETNTLVLGVRRVGAGSDKLFNGFMSRMIIHDNAVWTSDFTAPARTDAITPDTTYLFATDFSHRPEGWIDSSTFDSGVLSFNAELDGDRGVMLDGADDRVIVLGGSNQWNYGSDDFTIQLYAKWDAITDGSMIGVWDDGATNRCWQVRYDGDINTMKFEWENTSSGYNAEDFSWTPSTGVWYHISFVNNGGTLTFRVDGTTVGTPQTIAEIISVNDELWIGARRNGSSVDKEFEGTISRVETLKGLALWTSDFTAPVRTSDITNSTETTLAMVFDGPAGLDKNRVLDLVKPAYGVESPAPSPIIPDISGLFMDLVQTDSTKNPLYDPQTDDLAFDGVDDYLSATFTQAQPFTLYMVANVTADTVQQILFGDANAKFGFDASEQPFADAGTTVTDTTDRSGTKHLFAVRFDNTNGEIYLNGVSVATGTVGTGALAALGLGARNDGNSPTAMDFYAAFLTSEDFDVTLNNLIETKYGV